MYELVIVRLGLKGCESVKIWRFCIKSSRKLRGRKVVKRMHFMHFMAVKLV